MSTPPSKDDLQEKPQHGPRARPAEPRSALCAPACAPAKEYKPGKVDAAGTKPNPLTALPGAKRPHKHPLYLLSLSYGPPGRQDSCQRELVQVQGAQSVMSDFFFLSASKASSKGAAVPGSAAFRHFPQPRLRAAVPPLARLAPARPAPSHLWGSRAGWGSSGAAGRSEPRRSSSCRSRRCL